MTVWFSFDALVQKAPSGTLSPSKLFLSTLWEWYAGVLGRDGEAAGVLSENSKDLAQPFELNSTVSPNSTGIAHLYTPVNPPYTAFCTFNKKLLLE